MSAEELFCIFIVITIVYIENKDNNILLCNIQLLVTYDNSIHT